MKLNGLDYLNLSSYLAEDECMIQQSTREFVDNEIIPIIEEHFENATFPDHLVKKFGEMGFLGMNLPEKYNCAGMSNVAYGLMCQEMERGDSGVSAFVSVHPNQMHG